MGPLIGMARYLCKKEILEPCFQFLEKAITERARVLGHDDWLTINAKRHLVDQELEFGKFAPRALEVFESLLQYPKSTTEEISDAAKNVARSYSYNSSPILEKEWLIISMWSKEELLKLPVHNDAVSIMTKAFQSDEKEMDILRTLRYPSLPTLRRIALLSCKWEDTIQSYLWLRRLRVASGISKGGWGWEGWNQLPDAWALCTHIAGYLLDQDKSLEAFEMFRNIYREYLPYGLSRRGVSLSEDLYHCPGIETSTRPQDYYEHSLHEYERRLLSLIEGNEIADLPALLNAVAAIYWKQKRYANAGLVYQMLLWFNQFYRGEDDSLTVWTRCRLGDPVLLNAGTWYYAKLWTQWVEYNMASMCPNDWLLLWGNNFGGQAYGREFIPCRILDIELFAVTI
ncbi:hypothetical protein F5882DRAFT_401512 [Hyaloscypha sp. PMI_1271]|nr:hypothetical protein F5882DRAFT_401512 [Hyaloscypha sp. PMI_1271]